MHGGEPQEGSSAFPTENSKVLCKIGVSHKINHLLNMVPQKRHFRLYRLLPFFFVLGGAMEWFMINVRIGKETFYDVYRRKQSERRYKQSLEER
ncbi:ubiquinol-cytochrome c reductase complex assembly factor 5 isoform X2 [Pogona vitticeps]|uniref:Ubiquinol-cytochrome c reductase complex assembly factor 5 n=1 Tax=Pogona vitticeps TaxID=103695 RepID=A0A6J0U206_9SAUR|nr:small integral membrane protein 4 [Pogona vitticeps]